MKAQSWLLFTIRRRERERKAYASVRGTDPIVLFDIFHTFCFTQLAEFCSYEDAAINCREIENQSGKIERDSQENLPEDSLNY